MLLRYFKSRIITLWKLHFSRLGVQPVSTLAYSRRWLRRAFLSAGILISATGLNFAEANEETEADNSISGKLTALSSEVDILEKEMEDARDAWDEERRGLDLRRRELAERKVELALERERLLRQRDELEENVESMQNELRELESTADSMMRGISSLAEAVDLHLVESPDSRILREIETGRLQDIIEVEEWQQRAESAVSWLEQFDGVHDSAGELRKRQTEIYTASGKLEKVELFSAGRIGFAYRTIDDGRFGIAAAAPEDASGYRWLEPKGNMIQQRLKKIYDDDYNPVKEGVPHLVPMDVTGRLSAESAVEDRGFWGDLEAGGVVMIPLTLVALIALILMMERLWILSRAGRGAQSTADSVLAACRNNDFVTAEHLAAEGKGVMARVLHACLKRRQQGRNAMEDTIQEQLLHESPVLERFLTGIAVLGTAAPLLGLLGTVTGIIRTFAVITAFGDPDPSLMAGGISEALMTTAAGLAIAVPILLLHSLLRGKADLILSNAEKHAATLLNILEEEEDDKEVDKKENV